MFLFIQRERSQQLFPIFRGCGIVACPICWIIPSNIVQINSRLKRKSCTARIEPRSWDENLRSECSSTVLAGPGSLICYLISIFFNLISGKIKYNTTVAKQPLILFYLNIYVGTKSLSRDIKTLCKFLPSVPFISLLILLILSPWRSFITTEKGWKHPHFLEKVFFFHFLRYVFVSF